MFQGIEKYNNFYTMGQISLYSKEDKKDLSYHSVSGLFFK